MDHDELEAQYWRWEKYRPGEVPDLSFDVDEIGRDEVRTWAPAMLDFDGPAIDGDEDAARYRRLLAAVAVIYDRLDGGLGFEDKDPLVIKAAAILETEGRVHLDKAIRRARDAGLTWPAIASAVWRVDDDGARAPSPTPQAIQQRDARRGRSKSK